MGDLIRKFDVPEYFNATSYGKYEVVKYTTTGKEYYFVSVQGGHSGQLNTTSLVSNAYWKRFDDYFVDFATVWTPTYSTSVDTAPRVVDGALDEGISSIQSDGINTHRLSFNLIFEKISDAEAKSLLCYFDYQGSTRSFRWTPPSPYDQLLSFNLVSIRHSFSKKNENTININIEQSFVVYGVGAGQQRFGIFGS